YGPNGDRLWTARFSQPENSGVTFIPRKGLALDSLGNAYITGDAYSGAGIQTTLTTIKYDKFGNQLWRSDYAETNHSMSGSSIQVAATNVLVVGFDGRLLPDGSNSIVEHLVLRYTQNGNPAPAILAGPQDIVILAAFNANFSVSAAGTDPGYQWRRFG